MFSRFRPSSRRLIRATHAVPATPTWSVNHLLSSYPNPAIDNATLVHLHKLSALHPPPLGSPHFTALKHDIEQLIRLVEAVKLVDTTGVKIHDGLVTEFAADNVPLSADSEPTGRALLGHAKQTKDGFYIQSTMHVSGNAPAHVKDAISNPCRLFSRVSKDNVPWGFAVSIMQNLVVSQVSLLPNNEEPVKDEARVVCNIVVKKDMLNGSMSLHGGCSAYLVDVCSSLPIIAYGMVHPDKQRPTVSQSINMTYHSPAALGEELKVVSTTMTMTSRTEIWNATRKRLVASGVHVKMEPSQPKANL